MRVELEVESGVARHRSHQKPGCLAIRRNGRQGNRTVDPRDGLDTLLRQNRRRIALSLRGARLRPAVEGLGECNRSSCQRIAESIRYVQNNRSKCLARVDVLSRFTPRRQDCALWMHRRNDECRAIRCIPEAGAYRRIHAVGEWPRRKLPATSPLASLAFCPVVTPTPVVADCHVTACPATGTPDGFSTIACTGHWTVAPNANIGSASEPQSTAERSR